MTRINLRPCILILFVGAVFTWAVSPAIRQPANSLVDVPSRPAGGQEAQAAQAEARTIQVTANEASTIQATTESQLLASETIAAQRRRSYGGNANGKSLSSTADLRVTVTTSTIWGILGIAIVAIALLAVLGAVARFGRR